jgi:hypothetical protein
MRYEAETIHRQSNVCRWLRLDRRRTWNGHGKCRPALSATGAGTARRPATDCGPDALIAGRRMLPRRGYIHADGPTPSRPLGLQNRPELWARSPTPHLASARTPSAAIGCSSASESCQVLLPAISSRGRLVGPSLRPPGLRWPRHPRAIGAADRAPTAGMRPIIHQTSKSSANYVLCDLGSSFTAWWPRRLSCSYPADFAMRRRG